MHVQIVCDSSCDMNEIPDPNIGFATVPFVITADGRDFVDDHTLDHGALMHAMENCHKSHTSCPSPGSWEACFMKADKTIALTISSNLSGSYQSAMTARAMVLEAHPEKQIEVIDSLSTGPKLIMMVQDVLARLRDGAPLDQLCDAVRREAEGINTLFTLSSFKNLVMNGRVSALTSFLAGKLNMHIVGAASEEGRILIRHKMRGRMRALEALIREMEQSAFEGGRVVISHCCNAEYAAELAGRIREKWQRAQVTIVPTRGLDSYYAERNGLIVSF